VAAADGARTLSEPLLAALLILLALLALVAVRAGDLLLATIALGGYGFVMALAWAAMGAVDVAFTEAVVGAGASTVFMLAAILRTSRRRSPVSRGVHWPALLIVLVLGLALASLSAALPDWDDPDAPSATHVAPRYLTEAVRETATPNAVTAVLADYRSYDTLIETVVIFTAGLGCWLLLGPRAR
jgi:multicomponent Na+:H+ antiporter subunit B